MIIKGRGSFVGEASATDKDTVRIRVDNESDMSFWLEITISREELVQLISDTDDLEEQEYTN